MALHLLRPSDLTPAEIGRVLDLAVEAKAGALDRALEGRTLVAIFQLPSTRTRIAFAAAAHRLGMATVAAGADELQLARGESVADTARTLSALAATLVVRTREHELLEELAEAAAAPVINALSPRQHPCEALVGLFTLRERLGRLAGLKLAFVGAGNNVSHSLLEAGAAAGMEVRLASPARHGPDPGVVARAGELAAETGGTVRVTHDPRAGVEGADVVYTDVWGSMGGAEVDEREFAGFRVDAELMALAAPGAVFLHCLPARRGFEVASEVIDGPRSLVWEHVANQVPVVQAVLFHLLRHETRGA